MLLEHEKVVKTLDRVTGLSTDVRNVCRPFVSTVSLRLSFADGTRSDPSRRSSHLSSTSCPFRNWWTASSAKSRVPDGVYRTPS